jgi:hypothetical protein
MTDTSKARSCIETDQNASGRKNPLYQQQATESSPLNVDQPGSPSSATSEANYWTFSGNELSPATNKRLRNSIAPHGMGPLLRSQLRLFVHFYPSSYTSPKQPVWNLHRKVIAAILFVFVAAIASFYRDSSSNDRAIIANAEPSLVFSEPTQETESEWLWDHNVYYLPKSKGLYDSVALTDSGSQDMASAVVGRNLLIAQVVGESYRTMRPLPGPNSRRQLLAQFADITSRPNRAYARQWGRNYVRFQDDSLVVAAFLKSVRDRQLDQQQLSIPYDTVALLPPGAIVVDLDYDLLDLIPADKLLAIAGWDGESKIDGVKRRSEVIFFNLKHTFANTVINRWWGELEGAQQRHNAASHEGKYDDLNILIHVIESLLNEGEDLQSVVYRLDEAAGGFVLEVPNSVPDSLDTTGESVTPAPYCIKSFSGAAVESPNSASAHLPISAQLLSDPEVTRATLQSTADAVCYRYYPKCEIM